MFCNHRVRNVSRPKQILLVVLIYVTLFLSMGAETPENDGFKGPDAKTPDAVKAWLEKNNRTSELSAVSNTDKFIKEIDNFCEVWKGGTLEEKNEAFETLRVSNEDFIVAQMGPCIDMENSFDRLHNQVPWESRYGEQTYDTAVNIIDDALRRTRRKSESEKELEISLLKEAKRTALWAQGLFQVLEGSATALDTYFAGEDQMRQLLTTHVKITETSFEKAFSKDLPGLVMTPDERNNFVRGKVYQTSEFGDNVESFRDLAIKYQDERLKIAMLVAEVQQEDFDNPPSAGQATKPREREAMYIELNQRKLIYEIFGQRKINPDGSEGEIEYINWKDSEGKDHEVPVNILNFYTMEPTEDNKRKYKALVQSMLSLGALDQLKDGRDPMSIGTDVRSEADRIVKNIYAEEMFSVKDKLAMLIVRSGIDLDWGMMSAGELGWGWKYDAVSWDELSEEEKISFVRMRQSAVDASGQVHDFVVLRTSMIGSIYSALDIQSPMYTNRHVWDYHANSETTSQMHLATPDGFRREVPFHKPDWMPSIEKYLSYNSVLRKLLYKLFTDGYKDEQFWDGESGKYGELDPRVLKYMKENINAWPSWPTIDGKKGQFWAMPLFFKSHWLSLNFWRSIGEKGGDAKEVPSLWERFKEGLKLSEVPFLKYKDVAVDWNNVNKAQFARVLLPLFLPHKLSRDIQGEYDKFFPEEPSADGIKELAKRIRLGVRGETAEMGVIEIVMIPYLINLHLFKTKHLMGVSGNDGDVIKDVWQDALIGWANEAANLPPTKGLKRSAIKNYNKSLAMLIDFYGSLFLNYAETASTQTNGQMVQAGVHMKSRLNDSKSPTNLNTEDVMKVLS